MGLSPFLQSLSRNASWSPSLWQGAQLGQERWSSRRPAHPPAGSGGHKEGDPGGCASQEGARALQARWLAWHE